MHFELIYHFSHCYIQINLLSQLFEMEYLSNQSGGSFHPTEDELDSVIDEGFEQ